MDVVFVSLQFLFGTKGLLANVAGILIFRIVIHFQTSSRDVSVTISDLNRNLPMRCRSEKECLLHFFGEFQGKKRRRSGTC